MGKRWGKADFQALKDLEQRLDKLEKTDFDRFCREAAADIAGRLLTKAKKRTPVGVVPKDIYDNKNTTVTAVGASGKKRKFASRESAIYQQYWAGYTGGTLRDAWTILPVEKQGNTRIAVFRAGVDTVSVLLNENGECAIPWEILVKAGLRLNVGIYGTKGGNTVLPTVWADLGKILPGVTFGENTRPPTPNQWDGTANHQHPIEAIIGLAEMLEQIPRPMTAAELQNILNGGDKVQ